MSELRQALAGAVVVWLATAPACRSTLEPPTGELRLDLRHDDPRVRVLAARQAVEELGPGKEPDAPSTRRREVLDLLVKNLEHRDGAVRFFTAIALRKLTGQDLGFLPHGTPDERARAVERWRAWIDRASSGTGALAGNGQEEAEEEESR